VSKANFGPSTLDEYEVVKSAPAAFAGATTDARGAYGEANASLAIFTVTGDVIIRLIPVCTTLLAGSGKLEVGVTGNLAGIIAETTATDIDANDIWKAAAPADVGVLLLSSIVGPFVVVNGLDILETTTTADITSGQIYYICLWHAASPDGNVVAA